MRKNAIGWGAAALILTLGAALSGCGEDSGESQQVASGAGGAGGGASGGGAGSAGAAGSSGAGSSGASGSGGQGAAPAGDGKVGSACAADAGCSSPKALCLTSLPGGYCTVGCQIAECPSDSWCMSVQADGATKSLCARTCMTDGDCRKSEGYRCVPLALGFGYCGL